MQDIIDILIVDDERVNLILLDGILKKLDGVNVVQASSGQEALELVMKHDFSVVLLDIMMPDLDGFQVAEILRSNEKTQHLPIIFVTAINKEQRHVFKGYGLGAVDYLFKPVEPEILKGKVKVFVDLHRKKRSLEETTTQLELTVSQLRKSQEALKHQALHDPLTGLANRTLCLDRIRQAMERSQRRENYFFAVAFLDVDRFKVINDSMGHAFGDKVLLRVAEELKTCVRGLDTVSRYGGDEFVLLMEELVSPREGVNTVRRVRDLFIDPLIIDGYEVKLTCSVGVVLSPQDNKQPEELLQNANIAMHRAKTGGRDKLKIFNSRMLDEAIQQMFMETDLRKAITNNEFYLEYQPIVSLEDGNLRGFEALLRWLHPKKGLISPMDFIPMAEETGLILPIGRWVLQRACMTMAAWRRAMPDANGLFLSVNISGKQFSQPDLLDLVKRALDESQIPPEILRLEITETAIMENAAYAVERLTKLKNAGVGISIDDFGTGYSSMSYLQRFPLDALKVDISFIRSLDQREENKAIVKAIVNLAHTLNLKVIAEGVEKNSQRDYLVDLGCEFGQGYMYARPLGEEKVIEMILKSES